MNGRGIVAMFAMSSVLAVAHNLVNYKLVQHTSAVSATVIGEVKTITLIILSAFILGKQPGCQMSSHRSGLYLHTPARHWLVLSYFLGFFGHSQHSV